jgi:hypothetical protein
VLKEEMDDAPSVNGEDTSIRGLQQPKEDTTLLSFSGQSQKQTHYISSTFDSMPPPKSIQDIFEYCQRKPAKRPVNMKTFWKVLIIVAMFYALPSIQFVFFQYLTNSANLNQTCYYNFKCKIDFMGLAAFNNVTSNIAYVLVGVVFAIVVKVTKPREDNAHGLHTDMSLYYCMALATVFEGIFSALYHICPSRLNYQFDTTFMLVGGVLLFVTIYQKRQHSLAPGPFRTFGLLVVLVFLNFFALIRVPPYFFWVVVFLLWTYYTLLGSYHILHRHRLPLCSLLKFIKALRRKPKKSDKARYILIIVVNVITYTLLIVGAVYGVAVQETVDFTTLILAIIMFIDLMYLVWYTFMKFRFGERPLWYIWIIWIDCIAFFIGALYFFQIAVTNKFLTPEESRELNRPCILFDFFDTHDVWHFLSAFALFCAYLLIYLLDMDITHKPRYEIPVF